MGFETVKCYVRIVILGELGFIGHDKLSVLPAQEQNGLLTASAICHLSYYVPERNLDCSCLLASSVVARIGPGSTLRIGVLSRSPVE